eukprot:3455481-Amphidinium_carterae.1
MLSTMVVNGSHAQRAVGRLRSTLLPSFPLLRSVGPRSRLDHALKWSAERRRPQLAAVAGGCASE